MDVVWQFVVGGLELHPLADEIRSRIRNHDIVPKMFGLRLDGMRTRAPVFQRLHRIEFPNRGNYLLSNDRYRVERIGSS